MSRNDRNIEDLFRTLFDQFTVNPTPGLWNKVQSRLIWKQFLTFGLNSFNIYYLALFLSMAGVGTHFLLSRTTPDGISENPLNLPSNQIVQPESTLDQVISTKDHIAALTVVPEPTKSSAEKKSTIKPKNQPAVQQKEPDLIKQPDPITDQEQAAVSTGSSKPQTLSSENIAIAEPDSVKVRINFKAIPQDGCSPLAVSFQNFSENVSKISWNFGDGGNSNEINPSYVFDEPGKFQVILTVQGDDGQDHSQQQIIEVFETPQALFEFDADLKPAKNQPINFYNYSRGGDFYEWDFGDKQRSNLQEPIHFYQKAGNYHVKLKVWTDHQCYDSMMVFNAFTTQEQKIKFPNAFTPNLNGPTGGYYDANDINNTVFHPVTNGELLEFQLKVFNREGVLLFESNDISIGWDGYYCEQLVKQDVYIWKIRGKFNNGKTFVESGDVTLIKQN